MENLKPCPFCGGKAEVRERSDTDKGYIIYVGCSDYTCFCRITKNLWFDYNKSDIQYIIDRAIEEWNRRITDEK